MEQTATQGINHFLFMCAVGFLSVVALQSLWKWWREQVNIRNAISDFHKAIDQARQYLISTGRPTDAFDEAVKKFVRNSRDPLAIRAAKDIVSILAIGHETAISKPHYTEKEGLDHAKEYIQ